jgi:hypothetical protein
MTYGIMGGVKAGGIGRAERESRRRLLLEWIVSGYVAKST